jgi:hypothetical protein
LLLRHCIKENQSAMTIAMVRLHPQDFSAHLSTRKRIIEGSELQISQHGTPWNIVNNLARISFEKLFNRTDITKRSTSGGSFLTSLSALRCVAFPLASCPQNSAPTARLFQSRTFGRQRTDLPHIPSGQQKSSPNDDHDKKQNGFQAASQTLRHLILPHHGQ